MTPSDRAILLAILALVRAAADLLIRILGREPYDALLGTLERATGREVMSFDGASVTWGAERYRAVSGPHGKGALPPGTYAIDWPHLTDSDELASGFRGPDGDAWFVPLIPEDVPDIGDRSGFGIHPDGGQPGTRGCVGLDGNDARAFWARVHRTSLRNRPPRIHVDYPEGR